MEICFYFFNSFTSFKVEIVLLSQSGFLCAFLNWLEAGERKAVSGAPGSFPDRGGIGLKRAAVQLEVTGEFLKCRVTVQPPLGEENLDETSPES